MKNSIFLVFLLFSVSTMCQESEIQLTTDENEAAAESHISINPLNGDKAVIYKVHNSSGSVFVECKVITESQIFTHRVNNVTDPVVSYDGLGNLYICYLGRETYNNKIYVQKSTDNGQSFLSPVNAVITSNTYKADKQWFFIDKNSASPYYNRIYIGYTHLKVALPSEINMVYSSDFGLSFSEPLRISQQSPLGYFVLGSNITIDNYGNVYCFWIRDTPEGQHLSWPARIYHLYYSKSTDGGVSFSPEIKILNDFFRPGVRQDSYYYTKNSSASDGFRNAPLPYSTYDINNGNIYLVMNGWGDPINNIPGLENDPYNNANHLVLLKSSNGGASWTKRELHFEHDVFMPYISTAESGEILITVYNSNVPPYDNINTSISFFVLNSFNSALLTYTLPDSFKFNNSKIGDYIGDYYAHAYSEGRIYAVYSKPISNKLQMFMISIPIRQAILIQNTKFAQNNISNLDGSRIVVNNSQIYNSPTTIPDVNPWSSLKLSPEFLFYEPFRFYNWTDFNLRESELNLSDTWEVLNIKSFFAQSRPLTIRNYLEGGSADQIWFGESGIGFIQGDFQLRNSGFSENAFYYNYDANLKISYKAEAKQNITNVLNTNWKFLKWENGSTNRVREEQVGVNTSTEWKAIYKGIGTTDQQDAYTSNSQRKSVKAQNGNLLSIYESMGKVWLERSTNNGENWMIMNDTKPVDNSYAESPSIDYIPWSGIHSWIGGVYYPSGSGNLDVIFVRSNDSYIPNLDKPEPKREKVLNLGHENTNRIIQRKNKLNAFLL